MLQRILVFFLLQKNGPIKPNTGTSQILSISARQRISLNEFELFLAYLSGDHDAPSTNMWKWTITSIIRARSALYRYRISSHRVGLHLSFRNLDQLKTNIRAGQIRQNESAWKNANGSMRTSPCEVFLNSSSFVLSER
jgi:hypothetical protein